MDSLLGINASTPLISIGTNSALNATAGLLASELSLSSTGLFAGASAIVELSGLSQLLSAATTFQDQLRSLQPGTASSGGGRNFGTDFASLAAEAQSFVDTFNGLQNNITNINNTNSLLGGSVTGATSLTNSLDAQAQASFANGSSTLTNLSQLGINFQPSPVPGGGGSLSINLNTLQSAFNTDAAGAFSLLSQAANTFSGIAGNFVSTAGSQNASLAALAQTSASVDLLTSSLFSQAQTGNFNNLQDSELLAGGSSMLQVVLALNQYSMVSGLLG